MPTITPFLMFDGKLDEAVRTYRSIFKQSKITDVSRDEKGKIFSATFKLQGQEFMAFNGGPDFKFSHGVSFFISCKTQREIDYYWDRLSRGGKKERCGWVRDKFGLYWQVIPEALGELLGKDESGQVLQAMLKMKKIDIHGLKKAFARGHASR